MHPLEIWFFQLVELVILLISTNILSTSNSFIILSVVNQRNTLRIESKELGLQKRFASNATKTSFLLSSITTHTDGNLSFFLQYRMQSRLLATLDRY